MALPTITNKQKSLSAVKRDEAAMRKQYTRLRDLEVKRIQRAQEAGYLKGGVNIPTIKEIRQASASPEAFKAALASEYSRLSKLVETGSMRVGALREESSKRVETFQKLGYDFVTEENELQFGDFMGYMIDKYSTETPDGKKLLLDSDIIVEGFEYVQERTKSSNHSTLSRLFNDFLRLEGYM